MDLSKNFKIENMELIKQILLPYEAEYIIAVYGDILNSISNSIKCVIVITYYGIHFFKISMFNKNYIPYLFISHFDIKKFEYFEENSRMIITKNSYFNILSDKINLIENSISYALKVLYYNSRLKIPEIFFNYLKNQPNSPEVKKKKSNLSKIRYIAYCMKYDQLPDLLTSNLFPFQKKK